MPATECSGASNSVIEPSRAGMARPSVGDELRDHVDAGPVDAQARGRRRRLGAAG